MKNKRGLLERKVQLIIEKIYREPGVLLSGGEREDILEFQREPNNPFPQWLQPCFWVLNLVLQVYCSECGYCLWIDGKCLCPRCGHYEDDGI